ncbi:cation/acetate symporter [Comamonas sp. BIGb0152]|uniref:VC_2705 family sodium/solute symporter n=1 Tax=Comamonas sp. BIGb0152 TaxID=2940601 RepID=UPI00216814CC|nr:VC_2705 family sodium/solute symporter [Comamonas sp. BIGb0152]MCS4293334.1 cation/acetate symporter [Comamonas sp. BIGb0152]
MARIHKFFVLYLLGLGCFIALVAWAERAGLSRQWIGPLFLFVPVMMYAAIGVWGRTADSEEYYVAGRRIPPVYNGMATAADWMSAASFLSLSGALYLQGFAGSSQQAGGLAYLLGWSGGFVLVALLIAPQLRALNLYTLPDFFQLRYGGRWPRVIAALAAVLCSFSYVVAQIYAVGLIASRLTGVQFEIGIMLGLGGVLVCSFLGGMRAITWTQVAQYVMILLAFLIPVSWLAYQRLGNPVAAVAYTQELGKIAEHEKRLLSDPAEREVELVFLQRGMLYESRLRNIAAALEAERSRLRELVQQLRISNVDLSLVLAAGRELAALPQDEATARELWTAAMRENYARAQPLGGMPQHTLPYAPMLGTEHSAQEQESLSRRNFMALMFCLMLGTAGLPHLLTRYYTLPSPAAARSSVGWTLFFIVLLYTSAPALASLVKLEVMQSLVGSHFDALPAWIAQWTRMDNALLSIEDVNGDGIVQWGEIHLGADLIMLATPELGGLPFVVSGLVAAGGLAAALSTADGLLLTISNALVRDLYLVERGKSVTPQQRVILSKFTLLLVALAAAAVASVRSSGILVLVSASFSIAAAAFVPAMLLGLYWRGATRQGAVCGMAAGLGITLYYMVANMPLGSTALQPLHSTHLWWGIQPTLAAVFGVPLGVLVTWGVSCCTRRQALPRPGQG